MFTDYEQQFPFAHAYNMLVQVIRDNVRDIPIKAPTGPYQCLVKQTVCVYVFVLYVNFTFIIAFSFCNAFSVMWCTPLGWYIVCVGISSLYSCQLFELEQDWTLKVACVALEHMDNVLRLFLLYLLWCKLFASSLLIIISIFGSVQYIFRIIPVQFILRFVFRFLHVGDFIFDIT